MDFSPEGPVAIPHWVNGHAFLTVSQAFFDVVNPATGVAIRRVPLAGADEAQAAVAAARAAQHDWAEMGLNARRVCLGNLADGLEKYVGQFIKLLVEETGFDEARAQAEVSAAVASLRALTVGETGIVAVVVDASRPLAGFAAVAAPALLAGASVVVKPSPKAPSAVYALCELTARTEWPGGVLNLVQGDSAAISGLCATDIDRLVFAGERALAEQVGALAAAAGKAFVIGE